MAVSQGTGGGIIHHEIGNPLLQTKIGDTNDVGVFEPGDGTGFGAECFDLLSRAEMGAQDFDGSIGSQVEVLCQIDFGEAPLSKEALQMVVPKILPYKISHTGSFLPSRQEVKSERS